MSVLNQECPNAFENCWATMLPASFAVASKPAEPLGCPEQIRFHQKSISEFGSLYANDDVFDATVRAQLYSRAVELVPIVNVAAEPKPKRLRSPNPVRRNTR